LAHALLAIGTSAQLLGHPVVGGSWEGLVTEAMIDAAGPDSQFSCYCTAAGAEIDLVIEQGGRVPLLLRSSARLHPRLSKVFIGVQMIAVPPAQSLLRRVGIGIRRATVWT
jgi:uncharacterized protein